MFAGDLFGELFCRAGLAVELSSTVPRDAREPGSNYFLVAQSVKIVISRKEYVLNDILNVVMRYPSEHDAVDERREHSIQVGEGFAVARTGPIDDLSFDGSARCLNGSRGAE